MATDESGKMRRAILLAKCYSLILAWSAPDAQALGKKFNSREMNGVNQNTDEIEADEETS